LRHQPLAIAARVAAKPLDAQHVLRHGRCDRRGPRPRQVRNQGRKLPVRPRREGELNPLVELVRAQPSVAGRHAQHLDDAIPVLMRGPQPIIRHGQTLDRERNLLG
jgi:hypothetical protein